MTTFFDRTVRVIVGQPGSIGKEFGATTAGGSQLRIEFSTEKSSRRSPNKAKIVIYNLSKDSAAFIEAEKNHVKLFAGYGANTSMIFSGEVRKKGTGTVDTGTDRVTTIEAASGGQAYRSARINRSFSKQLTMHQVIGELAESFGTKANLTNIEDSKLVDGFVASGRSADVMETFARSLNFDWFFDDDGDLVVVTKNTSTDPDNAVLLSPTTGLIGSPERTVKGISATALLNPAIKPKRYVNIESQAVNGWFLVQKTEMIGDTGYSSTFYTHLEARAV